MSVPWVPTTAKRGLASPSSTFPRSRTNIFAMVATPFLPVLGICPKPLYTVIKGLSTGDWVKPDAFLHPPINWGFGAFSGGGNEINGDLLLPAGGKIGGLPS